MNQQEIATAVNNNIAVIMIIMNNGYLGMVRQWQELFFDKRYAETTLNGNPDFIKLVEAYGGTGIRVNKKQEFYPALEKALSLDKFVLIDCLIPKEENVFPMVNPGSPISKMIGVDHPGVLARVASLFTRRGFNIESLAVGHTEETGISRMTIVVKGDERVLEQITKQLNKLIDFGTNNETAK